MKFLLQHYRQMTGETTIKANFLCEFCWKFEVNDHKRWNWLNKLFKILYESRRKFYKTGGIK